MEMRDIATTQVLRGPQGTLFGRNTIGGAVLLTTNGPGEGAGNTCAPRSAKTTVRCVRCLRPARRRHSGPRESPVAIRKRDGYVTRVCDGVDLGDENSLNGQFSLRFKPNEDLSFTLRIDDSQARTRTARRSCSSP